MRYRLRTLVLLTAVAPPVIALLWFYGWLILQVTIILGLAVAACLIWIFGCLALARWLAEIIISPLN
jgi:hypothetical protein